MQYQIRKADRRHYPEIARLIVECKIGADTVEEQLRHMQDQFWSFEWMDGSLVAWAQNSSETAQPCSPILQSRSRIENEASACPYSLTP